ncbi:MAG: hypothetical protein V4651_13690 [Bacteroidota bacterium]
MYKQMISKIFIIVSLLLSFHQANAQDSTLQKTKPYIFGIGCGAGFATGYGLSFRYVPNKFGAQVNFAPYKDTETERYSIGVTFLYTVIASQITNLYIYQANHYYYNSQTTYVYNPNVPDQQEKIRSTESYVNNGVGFGIEIIMAKRIGLNLMTGYAFYNNFKQLNVTGEVALYYKF